MLVIVNHKYTYECQFKVKIGDTVVLPSGKGKKTWVGEITAIGSDYAGPVKQIIAIEKQKSFIRSIDEPWEPSLSIT